MPYPPLALGSPLWPLRCVSAGEGDEQVAGDVVGGGGAVERLGERVRGGIGGGEPEGQQYGEHDGG
ncbi:hypothetical protein [Nonomuraea sp. NPDC046570]|uniref:hypothetical protein n=1 Tax=Nonomuraea sp. NPDC046570 TaxID=3155255 RepID=UPI0033DF00F9